MVKSLIKFSDLTSIVRFLLLEVILNSQEQ